MVSPTPTAPPHPHAHINKQVHHITVKVHLCFQTESLINQTDPSSLGNLELEIDHAAKDGFSLEISVDQ